MRHIQQFKLTSKIFGTPVFLYKNCFHLTYQDGVCLLSNVDGRPCIIQYYSYLCVIFPKSETESDNTYPIFYFCLYDICIPICSICIPILKNIRSICIPILKYICLICIPILKYICSICIPILKYICLICIPILKYICLIYVSLF